MQKLVNTAKQTVWDQLTSMPLNSLQKLPSDASPVYKSLYDQVTFPFHIRENNTGIIISLQGFFSLVTHYTCKSPKLIVLKIDGSSLLQQVL